MVDYNKLKNKKFLTESEIRSIVQDLNKGNMGIYDTEFGSGDKTFRLTASHTKKGITWLKKQGLDSWREKNAIDNFDHFELYEFKNISSGNGRQYVPVYLVMGKDGSGFTYYYDWKKINITG